MSARSVVVRSPSVVVRLGLERLLSGAGFEVHEEPVASPHVLLVYGRQAGEVGQLEEPPHRVGVVVLADDVTDEVVRIALRHGSSAVLHRDVPDDVLLTAVRLVGSGHVLLSQQVVMTLLRRLAAPPPGMVLSDDELRWLHAIAYKNATVEDLAGVAGYSAREMSRRLTDLWRRLGAANRTEALVRATQYGLLDPDQP